MLKRFSFLFLILFITACGSQSESLHGETKAEKGKSAFPETPQISRSWRTLPISLYVDSTFPSEHYGAITKAIAVWEANGADYFEFKGKTNDGSCNPEDINNGDDANMLCWSTTPNANGYLGATHIIWMGSTLIEADVTVYGQPGDYAMLNCTTGTECHNSTNKYDLVTTLGHEMGHILGFSDTSMDGSLMNPDFSNGDVLQNLDTTLLSSLTSEYEIVHDVSAPVAEM